MPIVLETTTETDVCLVSEPLKEVTDVVYVYIGPDIQPAGIRD